MTDKILIQRFLDKNFDINIHNGKTRIFDKYSEKYIFENQFREIFFNVFDNYLIGNEMPIDIAVAWYKSKSSLISCSIDKYLIDCKVVLGSTDWTMYNSSGTLVTEKMMLSEFKDEYVPDFIKYHFNHRFNDMVFDESQRIMDKY